MSVSDATLWLRVRLSPWTLDTELAGGIDPASDPALALRAAQLCSPRHRRRLASWVERLARQSEMDARPGLSSAVPLDGERVAEARESLLRIAQVLRGPTAVSARGVAMLQRLLTDARSALYTDTANGAVELQVRAALEGLAGSSRGAAAAMT